MTSIKSFPSNYHDISWSQLYHLKSMSTQVLTGPLDNALTQEKVNDWQAVAQKLDQSIRATPPFYRYVLDVVTLHLLKKWVLRLMLPGVMNQIAFKVNEIALEKLSQSTGISRELLPCFMTLKKSEKYFNENKATYFSHEQEITLKQVESYLKEKIDLIVHHKTIPALPRWYHATRAEDVASKILSESKLVQHPAPAGHGVYFSTQHEIEYGAYCFALDQDMIHPLRSVSYFIPRSFQTNRIWIRVEHDVAVKWNSVAHIVVYSDQEERNLRAHLATAELTDDAAIAATCPIISDYANRVIEKCFKEAYGQTPFPDHWKRHSWLHRYQGNSLPAGLPYVENNSRKTFFGF